jgi:hypothetical protein
MKILEIQGKTIEDRSKWLKSVLTESVCDVTFTKVNGETRTMPCTLDPKQLPDMPVHVTNTNNPIDFPKVKKQNPETLSVWCLDKKEWRSFRVMNVIKIEVL